MSVLCYSVNVLYGKMYSEDMCYNIVVANKSLDFLWNVFSTKSIKACHTFVISSVFLLILPISIFCLDPFFLRVWQIILSIYTFDFRFVLKIPLYLEVCQRIRQQLNSFLFLISSSALVTSSPAKIASLLFNKFSSRTAPTVPNSILRKTLL